MKKGVTTNDPLADDDEKGMSNVHTPDGTQQMTVQHIPDEWRGVGSIPIPGVDGMGLNGMDPPPACKVAPGYPRQIFGPASPEFSGRRPPTF